MPSVAQVTKSSICCAVGDHRRQAPPAAAPAASRRRCRRYRPAHTSGWRAARPATSTGSMTGKGMARSISGMGPPASRKSCTVRRTPSSSGVIWALKPAARSRSSGASVKYWYLPRRSAGMSTYSISAGAAQGGEHRPDQVAEGAGAAGAEVEQAGDRRDCPAARASPRRSRRHGRSRAAARRRRCRRGRSGTASPARPAST